MKNLNSINDELDVLKSQMQILSARLAKEDVVSEKMFLSVTHARIKNLTPSKRNCYIGMAVNGLIMPAIFIYAHITHDTLSLPFLIVTLILLLLNAYRSFCHSRLHLDEAFQSESITKVAEEVSKWRRQNAIDTWFVATAGIAWAAYFIYEDWAEIYGSLDKSIFVFLIFGMVFSYVTASLYRVAKASKEVLGQIDSLKAE